MKTFFTFLFCLISFNFFGQIKLNSFPVDLKRSVENHQMINFVNQNTNEIYTFVVDKETVVGIKFNSAVFVSDSLTTSKPSDYQNLIGYSFSSNHNPVLHWITETNNKILSVEYDFSRINKDYITTETIFTNEAILTSFSNKGNFFIITDNNKNELKLYEIGAKNNIRILQTSDLVFSNTNNKSIKISQIFSENPLMRMETDFYNPLMTTAEKIKLYIDDSKAIFTFDLSISKTEILEIDLDSKTVSKKEFQQPTLENGANQSNSYYFKQKLFQVTSNKKQLLLSITDFKSNKVFKQFSLSETENPFLYSTFLIQTDHYKAETISTLKRFLRKIENSNLGFSIFQTNNTYIASFGSNKSTASSGGIALGIGVGIGSILAGGEFVDVGNFSQDRTQSVFLDFDCNTNFEIMPTNNTILATSIISGFLADKNNVYLYQTFKYRDYYVLSYYDKKQKEVILYKFENGFN